MWLVVLLFALAAISHAQSEKSSQALGELEQMLARATELRFGNETANLEVDAKSSVTVFNKILQLADQVKAELSEYEKSDFKTQSLREWDRIVGNAYNNLGEIWLYMENPEMMAQDFETALENFRKSEALGNVHAQHNLAIMYALGIGVVQDIPKAIVYDYFASNGGSLRAAMAMGYRHLKGLSVPKSCESAAKYYEIVADHVVDLSYESELQNIEITSLLDPSSRKKSSTDERDVVQYYQHNADAGDLNAQLSVGHMNYFGARGVRRNYQLAHHYYSYASAQGSPTAMAQLGQMYVEGLGVQQNNETAMQYFKRASEKGNPQAHYGVGYMYLHGYGVQKDLKLAYKYFKAGADGGYAEAQFALGTMHYTGEGVEQSESLALQYFTLASHQYHVRALYNLAKMYLNGVGTRPSCSMAVELYKKVAERGDWLTELKSAHKSYIEGDYEHAVMLYSRLAQEGIRSAQINAAYMLSLEQGYFYPNSNNISYLLWKHAADQGDSSALRIIGDYYYYGKLDLGYDLKKASEYYRNAAEKKDVHSMFNLGLMYQFGLGVDQDLHLAKRYYDQCADVDDKAYYPSSVAIAGLNLHRWFFEKSGNLFRF
jgi:SEL1 protein